MSLMAHCRPTIIRWVVHCRRKQTQHQSCTPERSGRETADRVEIALATRMHNMELQPKFASCQVRDARSWLGESRDRRVDQKHAIRSAKSARFHRAYRRCNDLVADSVAGTTTSDAWWSDELWQQ